MSKKWKDSLLDLKLQFLALYNQGMRGCSNANRLHINHRDSENWCTTIDLFGADNFLTMGSKKMKYTYETKLAAVKAVVDEGRSTPEVMLQVLLLLQRQNSNQANATNDGSALRVLVAESYSIENR